MVTTSLSERCGAGPGRSKACWIMADPFIVSSTMVKMVVRTMALSSISSTLLVCLRCLQTKAYYGSHFLSATRTKRIYVIERTSILKVLELFKQTGQQAALVIQEYGDIEGSLLALCGARRPRTGLLRLAVQERGVA